MAKQRFKAMYSLYSQFSFIFCYLYLSVAILFSQDIIVFKYIRVRNKNLKMACKLSRSEAREQIRWEFEVKPSQIFFPYLPAIIGSPHEFSKNGYFLSFVSCYFLLHIQISSVFLFFSSYD